MAGRAHEIEVAIAAIDGPRVSLLVSAPDGDGAAIPRARRFPFLAVCEAFQVQRGDAATLPAGWWLPGRIDVGARTDDHPYAAVLGRYRLDHGWGRDDRDDDFADDALIAAVTIRDQGARAVIELEVVDAALVRHLIPGTRWRIGWW